MPRRGVNDPETITARYAAFFSRVFAMHIITVHIIVRNVRKDLRF